MDSSENSKKKWTDEERTALAEKMDKELDDFINNLAAQKKDNEKNAPKKEFNYDEWEKEISQHPAFMTKLPEDGNSEYNEYIEAIRALKYDVGDTPEEIILDAEQHKTNGNKHFKLKKYRWACEEYTNGIKLKPNDLELMSKLYGNRAAANYEIGNNRSCQRDCIWALRLDPTNFKCITRMTRSLLNVNKVYEARDWLEKNLEYLKTLDGKKPLPNNWDEDVLNLKEEIGKKVAIKQRDERKERLLMKKKLDENEKYLKAFKKRNLKFVYPTVDLDNVKGFDLESLEVNISQLPTKECVQFDSDGKTLLWPILYQYPEIALTDVMKSSSEETVFEMLLETLSQNWLDETPWSIYKFGSIVITFECGKKRGYLFRVNIKEKLSEILSKEELFIKGGLPGTIKTVRTRSQLSRGIKDVSPVPQVPCKKRRTGEEVSVLPTTSQAPYSVREDFNESRREEDVQIEVGKANFVHTSDVIARITNDCDKDVWTNLALEYSAKELLVGCVTAAKHQTLNSVDQLKQRSAGILNGWKNKAGEFIRSLIPTPDADGGLHHVSGVQKILASRPPVQVFEEIESDHSDYSSN